MPASMPGVQSQGTDVKSVLPGLWIIETSFKQAHENVLTYKFNYQHLSLFGGIGSGDTTV